MIALCYRDPRFANAVLHLRTGAFADAPPCPQIRIIVPYSAGGASDLTAQRRHAHPEHEPVAEIDVVGTRERQLLPHKSSLGECRSQRTALTQGIDQKGGRRLGRCRMGHD